MAGRGDTTKTETLAEAAASPGRRWMGVGCLFILGLLLVWIAFSTPPDPAWQAMLIGFGLVSLLLADKMRRATARAVVLTRDGLFDSTGAEIARIENIASMDRGMFAFKPSNGFLLRLTEPGPRAWHPGIWWRLGRRIGIGGVMPGYQTKPMTEILQVMLIRRDAEQEK